MGAANCLSFPLPYIFEYGLNLTLHLVVNAISPPLHGTPQIDLGGCKCPRTSLTVTPHPLLGKAAARGVCPHAAPLQVPHGSEIRCADLSVTGKVAAAGCVDGMVGRWMIRRGREGRLHVAAVGRTTLVAGGIRR